MEERGEGGGMRKGSGQGVPADGAFSPLLCLWGLLSPPSSLGAAANGQGGKGLEQQWRCMLPTGLVAGKMVESQPCQPLSLWCSCLQWSLCRMALSCRLAVPSGHTQYLVPLLCALSPPPPPMLRKTVPFPAFLGTTKTWPYFNLGEDEVAYQM